MQSDDILEMPFLRNIGFVLTYKCQVSCPHCIIEAGPHRKEEMLLWDALRWTAEISDYRDGYVKVLSLTGGEPFYNLENLQEISSFARNRGLLVSAVTNAFWAHSEKIAEETLRSLPALKLLAISSDVYHQIAIPFDNVKNAIAAAKKQGIAYNVTVCVAAEEDESHRELMANLNLVTEPETIVTATTFPAGRALKRATGIKCEMTQKPPSSACGAGSSPIIFPDGRVIACIGPVIDLETPHPLILGNVHHKPLKEILDDAEKNPVLHAIRVWGPRKLISIIREAGQGQYLPPEYLKENVCSACYNLMSERKLVKFLYHLSEDPEFRRKVAYARVYYLNETRMAENLGL